jgi:hypothetical protein
MKKAKTSSKTSSRSRRAPRTIHGRCVRVDLSYVLDMGRDFHVSGLPHEVVGLKDDAGGLILRGLVHASTPFRVRYELGDIKLVPSSIKLAIKVVRVARAKTSSARRR